MSEYIPIPYPRMLYKGGAHCIVQSEAEEQTALEEGWGNGELNGTLPKNKVGRPRKTQEA